MADHYEQYSREELLRLLRERAKQAVKIAIEEDKNASIAFIDASSGNKA